MFITISAIYYQCYNYAYFVHDNYFVAFLHFLSPSTELFIAEFHEFKLQSLVRHSFDLAAQEKQNHQLDELSTQVDSQDPFLFSSLPLVFLASLLPLLYFLSIQPFTPSVSRSTSECSCIVSPRTRSFHIDPNTLFSLHFFHRKCISKPGHSPAPPSNLMLASK